MYLRSMQILTKIVSVAGTEFAAAGGRSRAGEGWQTVFRDVGRAAQPGSRRPTDRRTLRGPQSQPNAPAASTAPTVGVHQHRVATLQHGVPAAESPAPTPAVGKHVFVVSTVTRQGVVV